MITLFSLLIAVAYMYPASLVDETLAYFGGLVVFLLAWVGIHSLVSAAESDE